MSLKTGLKDDNGIPIFLGDTLLSKYKYQVVVEIRENGDYYGRLVCKDDHSCKDIPYALNGGRGYTVCE